MPYRIDVADVSNRVYDRLADLGALDIEVLPDGIAALMPDAISLQEVAAALNVGDIRPSLATPRDRGSTWTLRPRPIQIGSLRIVPADTSGEPDALRLVDGLAFGTGLHPTTALCLEALAEAIEVMAPDRMLDVGTGSGVLALAALKLGVDRVVAIDTDDEALPVAAENARLNRLDQRLALIHGGPSVVTGTWPLVVANILAAPLIEMAPALTRVVGHHGRLVLSGIPVAVERDVDHAYRRCGMHHIGAKVRAGWVAVVLQASW